MSVVEEEEVLKRAYRTLLTAAPAMPRAENLQALVEAVERAEERGYFEPDEDENLREVYSRYLALRGSLWEMVLTLKPLLKGEVRYEVFGVAFCAAAMLVRSASFIVGLTRDKPLVRQKLDEGESRYGLERKTYTRVYRSVSSLRWMWQYQQAWRFYEANREEVFESLMKTGMPEVCERLQEEEPFFQKSIRTMLKRKVAYRWYSLLRRHVSGYQQVMFQFFKLGGCAVADLRQPFVKTVKGKRVTGALRGEAETLMKAGDVIVTRHDDALSNLFLPGFWPHAALYLGGGETLEAKKDGVKIRELEETLEVDAFLVLRPVLDGVLIEDALTRARTHEGKLYDFVFDFRKADRLVCTEVVYVEFSLEKQSGRLCLSAEQLIRQGLEKAWFEPLLCCGVEGDSLAKESVASTLIRRSLAR